jgi:hypothetical protein
MTVRVYICLICHQPGGTLVSNGEGGYIHESCTKTTPQNMIERLSKAQK